MAYIQIISPEERRYVDVYRPITQLFYLGALDNVTTHCQVMVNIGAASVETIGHRLDLFRDSVSVLLQRVNCGWGNRLSKGCETVNLCLYSLFSPENPSTLRWAFSGKHLHNARLHNNSLVGPVSNSTVWNAIFHCGRHDTILTDKSSHVWNFTLL